MQSKLNSLTESLTNVGVGFLINFFANMIIMPQFGFNISLGQNLALGAIFTVISIIRGYIVRRYFNSLRHNPVVNTHSST